MPREYGKWETAYKRYRLWRDTGLWQVMGRNDVSYRRRVAMDTVYAQTRSVAGDLQILAMTLPAVLMRLPAPCSRTGGAISTVRPIWASRVVATCTTATPRW